MFYLMNMPAVALVQLVHMTSHHSDLHLYLWYTTRRVVLQKKYIFTTSVWMSGDNSVYINTTRATKHWVLVLYIAILEISDVSLPMVHCLNRPSYVILTLHRYRISQYKNLNDTCSETCIYIC